MTKYTDAFYAKRHERTVYAANTVLAIVLNRIPTVRSAVDVGCGVGTWLSVLRERDIDIQGFDGPWVNTELLTIPRDAFQAVDLSKPLNPQMRFDLAISLEVAEHLPPNAASDFIGTLTSLSDFVLFSAAVCMQGGTGHVNEQWQSYWVGLFAKQGYSVHDFVRPRIWNDDRIDYFYKQNVLLFADTRRRHEVNDDISLAVLDVVHPQLFERHRELFKKPSIRSATRLLADAVKRSVRRRLHL
jgi:hypothetical protein